jgi:hypothetical protein
MSEEHVDYPCFICRRPESAHTDDELDTCLDSPVPIELADPFLEG